MTSRASEVVVTSSFDKLAEPPTFRCPQENHEQLRTCAVRGDKQVNGASSECGLLELESAIHDISAPIAQRANCLDSRTEHNRLDGARRPTHFIIEFARLCRAPRTSENERSRQHNLTD
jgi:transcription elongation factor Elf1